MSIVLTAAKRRTRDIQLKSAQKTIYSRKQTPNWRHDEGMINFSISGSQCYDLEMGQYIEKLIIVSIYRVDITQLCWYTLLEEKKLNIEHFYI